MNFKLGKTGWLILTAGILLIAFAGLGLARSQELDEQDRLREELSLARQRLSKLQFGSLTLQQRERKWQVIQVMSDLKTAKAKLSPLLGSIAANEALFQIAALCNVEITETGSSGSRSARWEGVACSLLELNLKAVGTLPDLVSFIQTLNHDFTTGFVRSVVISIPKRLPVEGEVEEELEISSVAIQLAVYSYQGD